MTWILGQVLYDLHDCVSFFLGQVFHLEIEVFGPKASLRSSPTYIFLILLLDMKNSLNFDIICGEGRHMCATAGW